MPTPPPPDLDHRIRQWLEPRLDAFLDDLATLVNRDCGTANKEGVDGVCDWVEARMRAMGGDVERRAKTAYGDMLLGRWKGRRPGGGRVLISGHMDTVYPVGTAAARPMRRDPADPNRLVGPGTCDMKAGLLGGLYAIAALVETGLDDWDEVAMICGSEEEVGSPVSRHWLMNLAGSFDAGLVLEPGRANGEVVTGRKGGGFWRVKVTGKAAHAGAEPEKGASAFLQLCHQALALDAINGTIPGATVIIGTARAGEAGNMVPPHAEMTVDARALTPEGLDGLADAVRAALKATEGRIAGTTTHVEGDVTRATMPRSEANLRLYALCQESAAAQGFSIGEQVSGGTSDGNFLATGGLAVLDGLGPVGGNSHSPDEYILIDSIVPRVGMLAGLTWRAAAAGRAKA